MGVYAGMTNSVPEAAEISHKLSEFLKANILAEGIDFDEDVPLRSLGVDSLALVEILLFIERQFGLTVPGSHLTRDNLKTVASLAQCVHKLFSEQEKKCFNNNKSINEDKS